MAFSTQKKKSVSFYGVSLSIFSTNLCWAQGNYVKLFSFIGFPPLFSLKVTNHVKLRSILPPFFKPVLKKKSWKYFC